MVTSLPVVVDIFARRGGAARTRGRYSGQGPIPPRLAGAATHRSDDRTSDTREVLTRDKYNARQERSIMRFAQAEIDILQNADRMQDGERDARRARRDNALRAIERERQADVAYMAKRARKSLQSAHRAAREAQDAGAAQYSRTGVLWSE